MYFQLLFQLNFALFEKVYLSKFIGKTEGLFFGRVDHARRVEVYFAGGGGGERGGRDLSHPQSAFWSPFMQPVTLFITFLMFNHWGIITGE